MQEVLNLFALSFKNVRRYARRSLASLLIMAGAVLALNVLSGYIVGNLGVLEQAFVRWGARGHLVIEQPTSELAKTVEGAGQVPLDTHAQAIISKTLYNDLDVAQSARMLRISGMLDAGHVSTVVAGMGWEVQAIRELKGEAYAYDVIAGKPLWQQQRPDAIVVGQGLAKVIGCQVPELGFAPLRPGQSAPERPLQCPAGPVQLSVSTLGQARVGSDLFTPVGVMDWGIKDVNDRLVVMDLAQAQRLLDTQSVSEFRVLLKDGADLSAVRDRLSQALHKAGLPVLVSRWSDRASFYHQVQSMMLGFLTFVLLVSLIVAYMSLLNSSYLNFMQRSKELGTLRSIGYSRRFVQSLAALENAWLALVAATVGALGAAGIAQAVETAGLSWTPPGSTNPVPIAIAILPTVYLVSGLAVVALAVLASAIPTRKILRRAIVQSLSSV